MARPPVLRQFLYRDDGLVRDFLAQLEGGISRQQRKSRRVSNEAGLSGGLNAGVAQLKAKTGGESFEEDERLIEQTAASLFEGLHQQLEATKALRIVERLEQKTWTQLKRGDIMEIEVNVQVAGFRKLSGLGSEMAKFTSFMETIGSAPDERTSNAVAAMKALSSLDNESLIPIIASAVSAPDHKFACLLSARFVRADMDSLEGEATLLGKLQRKLTEGETHIAMPGVAGLLRASGQNADGFLKIFDIEGASNFGLVNPRITDPGGVIVPLALFR